MRRPFACDLVSARAFPDRISARVLCQRPRWRRKLLRLCSFGDSFLVFGFQFVNYQLITVRILHDGHPAHRALNSFGSKTNLRLFKALDGSVKVFDFNSDAGAVFGWLPLIAHAADGQRVGTNLVFDPNTLAKFT